MSRQIAVRLPDDLVAFMDNLVAQGSDKSRAAVVTRALERERRRALGARDVEILSRIGTDDDDDDMERLAEYAARLPINLP
jgi:Arc/MetJ-type ribon-helix-helix transcriptional regulator